MQTASGSTSVNIQGDNVRLNVTLRRVHVTILTVMVLYIKQKYKTDHKEKTSSSEVHNIVRAALPNR